MAVIAVCECGWRSKRLPSTATASYAGRRHLCSRYAITQARAARVQARRDDPGIVRACHHKQASHQHGTRAAYVLDKCRCRPCRDATAAAERRRSKEKAYGRWQPYVDATPAREHVQALMAAGLGHKRIAALSGVPHGAVSALLYGRYEKGRSRTPTRRIRAATEARLLAVTATEDTLGARVGVDPTGTRRRLQALVAVGWSMSRLGRRLGVEPSNFTRTVHGPGPVGAATARAARNLYGELADQAPPEANHREKIAASRARNYAKARGWLSPLWWDDETIDNPDHHPAAVATPLPVLDEIAVERATAGVPVALTAAERDEAIRRLLERGHNKTEIARRLRLSGATATRLLGIAVGRYGELEHAIAATQEVAS